MALTLFDLQNEGPPTSSRAGKAQKKPATMKLTFASAYQLEQALKEVQPLLKGYPGAFVSVKAGEL